MHLLIVEDDRTIAENLYDFLEACGHQCDFAHSLAAARLLCAQTAFDALLLDRNLPDGDGATLTRQLRASGNGVPVLMLTARETLEDKLDGFAAGADDYLAKPFALKEVEVRLQAILRRGQPAPAGGCLRFGDLTFNATTHTLHLGGHACVLPPKGMRLLEVLLQQPQRVFTRRELEIALWGHEQASSDKLRSVLHTVRKAMTGQTGIRIANVHGQGYKLVDAENVAAAPARHA